MYQELFAKLQAAGQSNVLRFWNELNEMEKKSFADELNQLDLDELTSLIQSHVLNRPRTDIPADLSPASFFPMKPGTPEQAHLYALATAKGEELLRAGKVSVLTVAGGQGTRLGFDGPKGTYPIGPITDRSLFAYFAEGILRAGEKYGTTLTWYIMTSLLNHEDTCNFFKAHNYFGLNPNQIFFFVQGTMPAIGYDGKLLLAAKGKLALSPNGHGGTLLALRTSGALDRMKSEGVELLSYFQVDNPLVPVVNPLFLGLHAIEQSQVSAIMLAKTGPFEKLGNFCVSNGRVMIIEYSDLPEELATRRLEDGSLAFVAGSPAIHVFSCDFIESLTRHGRLTLPWHRADKKVPYIDEDGNFVTPEEPNAVKLESFIFDAMPLAERTMILEADRKEQFAPTKNKTGVDSAESCREMLSARNIRRLRDAGVSVADSVRLEISPRLILDDEDAVAYVRETGLASIDQDTVLE